MMKALKSEQDAYEVMIYAETGVWLSEKKGKQDEINKAFIRQFPELFMSILKCLILQNFEPVPLKTITPAEAAM